MSDYCKSLYLASKWLHLLPENLTFAPNIRRNLFLSPRHASRILCGTREMTWNYFFKVFSPDLDAWRFRSWGGYPQIATFCHCDWSNFHILLLVSERRFQITKECDIWIPYQKLWRVKKIWVLDVLRLFLQHTYVMILEMYSIMGYNNISKCLLCHMIQRILHNIEYNGHFFSVTISIQFLILGLFLFHFLKIAKVAI